MFHETNWLAVSLTPCTGSFWHTSVHPRKFHILLCFSSIRDFISL